jgi:hypothetical protein
MTHYCAGDQVVIRFGKRQGQLATIIAGQQANAYKVKAEDGWIVYYSEKGLERKKDEVAPVVC